MYIYGFEIYTKWVLLRREVSKWRPIHFILNTSVLSEFVKIHAAIT